MNITTNNRICRRNIVVIINKVFFKHATSLISYTASLQKNHATSLISTTAS
jgi:hypothetical protein